MSQPSPYTPGEVALDVPGRGPELGFYRERAQFIGTLGGFAGRVVAYHAPRGLGKTSLLRGAQREFQAARIRTVWVTANEHENLLTTLLAEMTQLLPRASRTRKSVTEAAESVTAAFGVPGANVKATFKVAAPPAGAKVFGAAVLATVAELHNQGERGLVFLLDEMQAADRPSLKAVSYAWQELQAPDARPAAGFFAVGLPGSQEHVNKAATSNERWDFRELPDLEDGGAAAALAEPARQLGVDWEHSALARAVAEAQRYPYKVQLIGDAVWSAAGYPSAGMTLKEVHLDVALVDVARQMRSLHASRWRAASRQQKDALFAIARLGGTKVRREEVANLLGTTSRGLSTVRDRLLRAGTIMASDHGLISFTVPGFTEYVLALGE